MRRWIVRATAVAGIALVAACNEGETPAEVIDTELTPEESEELARLVLGSGYLSIDDQVPTSSPGMSGPSSVPISYSTEFSVEAPCPLGGTVAVDGAVSGVFDQEARSAEVDVAATSVHDNCSHSMNELTATLNGRPALALEAHLGQLAAEPSGLQTVDLAGAFAWALSDGRDGVCEIDLAQAWDPQTGTRTVSGSICGFEVSISETWSPGS